MKLALATLALFAVGVHSNELRGKPQGGAESDERGLKSDFAACMQHCIKDGGIGRLCRRECKNGKEEACGIEEKDDCVATIGSQDATGLIACFQNETKFPQGQNVTIVSRTDIDSSEEAYDTVVDKTSFPFVNQESYLNARLGSFGTPRLPAGVFYAESESEVMAAIECARDNGYKISPRGRGHSYQGLSAMDGYMVIDMSLMCHPDEFVIGDSPQDSWLLGEQQKVLGTVAAGAGCTNAVMLAWTAEQEEFKGPNGGIYLIGSCPSVGITGYATGGGQGDTTPYVGLGIDDVLRYKIVVYNEEEGKAEAIYASETENDDLYWYLRGGGSGVGVITELESVIVQSPEPTLQDERKFTAYGLNYKQDDESAKIFFQRLQDFLDPPGLPKDSEAYKKKIAAGSSRFGGGGSFSVADATYPGYGLAAGGLFLGSKAELEAVLNEYGLLDLDIYDEGNENNVMNEFDSHAEAQISSICNIMTGYPLPNGDGDIAPDNQWLTWTAGSYRPTEIEGVYTVNICKDLDLDDSLCSDFVVFGGIPIRTPDCASLDVIAKLAEVAYQPQSFFNREVFSELAAFAFGPNGGFPASTGGLVMPRVSPEVFLEVAKVGVRVNHFAHGAPVTLASDSSGYAVRDEFWLFECDQQEQFDALTDVLTNKLYDGDRTKMRGFYNYLTPLGNPDWRTFYFGDNYERLSEIKAKYDGVDLFGNPSNVEPAATAPRE